MNRYYYGFENVFDRRAFNADGDLMVTVFAFTSKKARDEWVEEAPVFKREAVSADEAKSFMRSYIRSWSLAMKGHTFWHPLNKADDIIEWYYTLKCDTGDERKVIVK